MTIAISPTPHNSFEGGLQFRQRSKTSPPGILPEVTGERVKVFVRVRPAHGQETGGALELHRGSEGSDQKLKLLKWADKTEHEFEFDDVLPPGATQQEVYRKAVEPVVNDVMQGFNGTVIAYGQTGAGKTHTLSSIRPHNLGMMPRAAADIFQKAMTDPLHHYVVTMAYIQIYRELIQDLFNPSKDALALREIDGCVYVAGATELEVHSMEDCLRHLATGERNRSTAFTAMNAHSSRSHAVVILTVLKRKRLAPSQQGAQKVRCGKLFLVDLAGSERLKKSGSTGLRATEAKAINLSLSTLGMCVAARADGANHVPFRSSKLTRLLQESLGGNAKTSMVIAVADAVEHCEETLQSLQFGSRAMCVKNAPVVNEALDYKLMNAELLAQLDSRDANAFELESELDRLQRERDALQDGMEAAQQRMDAMSADFCNRETELSAQLLAQTAQLQGLDLQRMAAESRAQALQGLLQQVQEQLSALRTQNQMRRGSTADAATQCADFDDDAIPHVPEENRITDALEEPSTAAQCPQDVQLEAEAARAANAEQLQVIAEQTRTIHKLQQRLEQLQALMQPPAVGASVDPSSCGTPHQSSSSESCCKGRPSSSAGAASGADSYEVLLAAAKAELARKDERIERLMRQMQVLQDAAAKPGKPQRKGLFTCWAAAIA